MSSRLLVGTKDRTRGKLPKRYVFRLTRRILCLVQSTERGRRFLRRFINRRVSLRKDAITDSETEVEYRRRGGASSATLVKPKE